MLNENEIKMCNEAHSISMARTIIEGLVSRVLYLIDEFDFRTRPLVEKKTSIANCAASRLITEAHTMDCGFIGQLVHHRILSLHSS